jgi:hypothetical protein
MTDPILAQSENLTQAYKEADKICDPATRIRIKTKILETQQALVQQAAAALGATSLKPR